MKLKDALELCDILKNDLNCKFASVWKTANGYTVECLMLDGRKISVLENKQELVFLVNDKLERNVSLLN